MVKPGGTGRPSTVISARLAPLPPRRSFWSLPPSANPCTKVVTLRGCTELRSCARDRSPGSGPEAALPLGVRADRPEEVDATEVGPVGLAEVELALRGLPEQEAAEPLL